MKKKFQKKFISIICILLMSCGTVEEIPQDCPEGDELDCSTDSATTQGEFAGSGYLAGIAGGVAIVGALLSVGTKAEGKDSGGGTSPNTTATLPVSQNNFLNTESAIPIPSINTATLAPVTYVSTSSLLITTTIPGLTTTTLPLTTSMLRWVNCVPRGPVTLGWPGEVKCIQGNQCPDPQKYRISETTPLNNFPDLETCNEDCLSVARSMEANCVTLPPTTLWVNCVPRGPVSLGWPGDVKCIQGNQCPEILKYKTSSSTPLNFFPDLASCNQDCASIAKSMGNNCTTLN